MKLPPPETLVSLLLVLYCDLWNRWLSWPMCRLYSVCDTVSLVQPSLSSVGSAQLDGMQ